GTSAAASGPRRGPRLLRVYSRPVTSAAAKSKSTTSRSPACDLVQVYRSLSKRVGALRFKEPVACTYNPLSYAREPFERYLERYASSAPREVLLVGMNPGPFGMVQTGVP